MSYAFQVAAKTFSNGAVTNTTPPTFGGISSATSNPDGSASANWSLATGAAATPIRYIVYAAVGASVSPASLFVGANIVGEARSTWTTLRFMQLGDQTTFLSPGTTLTVGVRAFSAQNIFDANTATANVTIAYPSFNTIAAAVWDIDRASHVTSGTFGEGVAAIKSKTDNLPADPASATQVATRAPAATALDNTVWTNAKAAFLDATISSRASSSDMTTALAALAAIFARTDVATSTRATPADITAAQNALTTLINAVAGNVWDQLLTGHTVAGSFGLNAQTPSLNPSQVASAVWDALTSAHTVAGSFGLSAQTPSLNPTQVADAVWDALTADHTDAGTFGLSAQTPSLDPSQVAAAVWNALTASYAAPGSFGASVEGSATSIANSAIALALIATSGGRAVPALVGRLLLPQTLVGTTLKPDILIGRIIDE